MDSSFIDSKTKRFGILGYPLSHSLSPIMHNGLLNSLKINAFYFPLELDQEKFIKMGPFLREIFQGLNVTVPYKETIISFLDSLTDEAAAIQAVNTVYLEKERWIGANTDWQGFVDNLEIDYKVPFKDKTVIILGAGGSARACVYGALKKGSNKVIVANRTLEKAVKLINSFSEYSEKLVACEIEMDKLSVHAKDADIIINTTSIGLKKEDTHFFDFHFVKKEAFVYDLIYSLLTDFLKKALNKGLSIGSGKGMLVRQGAYAFQLWTGVEPELQKMAVFAGFEGLI